MHMTIRLATVQDAPALLSIYGQYIDTTITFECALPTENEFAQRIMSISAEYPYLVCEDTGRIVGYAYAHRQKEREAYQWNAELSIYLDRSSTSKGIGKTLYITLIELLKVQGVKTVYGGVTVPNEKSERLHAGLGFRRLGTYRHTGYKCGDWQDVCWFEKAIASYDAQPSPVTPISRIPEEQIRTIIDNALTI